MSLLNTSGTFHGITISDYGIYKGMEKVYNNTGDKVVVDSEFNLRSHDFLIQSLQQDPMDHHALLVYCETTSVRKLSEWGV